jgi:hypothetical protein
MKSWLLLGYLSNGTTGSLFPIHNKMEAVVAMFRIQYRHSVQGKHKNSISAVTLDICKTSQELISWADMPGATIATHVRVWLHGKSLGTGVLSETSFVRQTHNIQTPFLCRLKYWDSLFEVHNKTAALFCYIQLTFILLLISKMYCVRLDSFYNSTWRISLCEEFFFIWM